MTSALGSKRNSGAGDELQGRRKRSCTVIDITGEHSQSEPNGPFHYPTSTIPDTVSSLHILEASSIENLATTFEPQGLPPLIAAQVRRVTPPRNAVVVAPFEEQEAYPYGKYSLKPRKFVEIKDGALLHIKLIVLDTRTDEVTIRGWKAIRTKTLEGKLQTGQGTKNELVYAMDVDNDDPRDIWEQCVEEVSIREVVRLRMVRRTNHLPKDSAVGFRYERRHLPRLEDRQELNQHIDDNECMVLRWVYIRRFATAQERVSHTKNPTNNCQSWTLRPLYVAECSPGLAKPVPALRTGWRGGHKLADQDVSPLSFERQDYTFCDACEFPSRLSYNV